MEKQLTKIDNIKNLWNQLEHKGKFMDMAAKEFDRSKKTLMKWWFSSYGDWSVPVEFQDRTIELLQNTIKNQKAPLRVD